MLMFRMNRIYVLSSGDVRIIPNIVHLEHIYICVPCAINTFTISVALMSSLQTALNPSSRGILLPTGIDADPFPRMYERLLMVRGISAGMLRMDIFSSSLGLHHTEIHIPFFVAG